MPAASHSFSAVAFVENFLLKDLTRIFPEAKPSPVNLQLALPEGGELFIFPFGAVVFRDVPPDRREAILGRLRAAIPALTEKVVREDFGVHEESGAETRMIGGALVLDRLTDGRSGVVALTVAQSAAMEYYERIVENLFDRTSRLVERLESRGTVALWSTRPLHRFIGEAVGVRSEVLAVLHLLDKPDAVWDDPGMDRIYVDLKGEFDLGDRYAALESKLRSVQEALELVLGVARDRRLVLLEVAIVALILFEIVLSLARGR